MLDFSIVSDTAPLWFMSLHEQNFVLDKCPLWFLSICYDFWVHVSLVLKQNLLLQLFMSWHAWALCFTGVIIWVVLFYYFCLLWFLWFRNYIFLLVPALWLLDNLAWLLYGRPMSRLFVIMISAEPIKDIQNLCFVNPANVMLMKKVWCISLPMGLVQ